MADDNGKAQSQTVWPVPKFYFEVKWEGGAGAGMVGAFQEVSGLETETQVIEYRAGNSPVFSTIKMPGIVKSGDITLKKGVFKGDNKFYDWYSKIKMNTIERTAITINLLDEAAKPIMTWKVKNAWPTKITSTDLKSDGNEVAVETIVVAHEGLEISAA